MNEGNTVESTLRPPFLCLIDLVPIWNLFSISGKFLQLNQLYEPAIMGN